MKALLFAYYVLFVLDVHPEFMRRSWQRRRVYSIAHEVAYETAAKPKSGLRLMQIAVRESGYDRMAVGKLGERGPWQIMPPAKEYGAREALRRMEVAGMVSFVGCRHASDVVTVEGYKTTCQEMIDKRIGPADRYFDEHPPPPESSESTVVAVAP